MMIDTVHLRLIPYSPGDEIETLMRKMIEYNKAGG